MKFLMLVVMDGNESLKCVHHTIYQKNEASKVVSSQIIEQLDGHIHMSDMYLGKEVDWFMNEVKHRLAHSDSTVHQIFEI